ncbi:exonuclease SbcCD subunit D [Cohnella thailandensis]|uniref:Nuclease SbcCD subunit D n=1 Tax=Cohnella thailandensis TaxID=557557 RepID=A0A841SXZ1_9BACL|nr:exonuclease SbcCD subunit D [Cohnella thailandensis]MBB6636132.1 exonuclease SbcCD subunit D [Cohnella thailandensis]MBP1973899.1 exonuclease SbcD [Cohnella thailandensis]
MKLFHTADWHLGKLVQNVYMTEDQAYVLEQLLRDIETEKPDAVIIAGDLYDRAVPPTEAVQLLNRILKTVVVDLRTPVLAVSGNHDSPSRLNFGSDIMKSAGLHMCGEFDCAFEPVVLRDEFGPVHFYLVPFADPATVRHALQQEDISSYDDAMRAVVERIKPRMSPGARNVFIGHAFVTKGGGAEPNTSDSERPLAIGGAEHVSSAHFGCFDYTALGHLHQAHHVGVETVRYSGSPLKYSISEEKHDKGYLIVELDKDGKATFTKKPLAPLRDMRTVEGYIEEIERQERSDDYIYVRLLDELPVLSPMERVRAVYPNAMHVGQNSVLQHLSGSAEQAEGGGKAGMDMLSLFRSFYKDAKGADVSEETEQLFLQVLREIDREEGERHEAHQADDDGVRAV